MILMARDQGPSGLSDSAYQTSPSIVSPITWEAIMMYLFRYAFQLQEQLLSRMVLPSVLPSRSGVSSGFILPDLMKSSWSLGLRGTVSFFQAQTSLPLASRSSESTPL